MQDRQVWSFDTPQRSAGNSLESCQGRFPQGIPKNSLFMLFHPQERLLTPILRFPRDRDQDPIFPFSEQGQILSGFAQEDFPPEVPLFQLPLETGVCKSPCLSVLHPGGISSSVFCPEGVFGAGRGR